MELFATFSVEIM